MGLAQLDLVAKLRCHTDWLDAYRSGNPVAPVCIEIDLTDRCNYHCPNCVWGDHIAGSREHPDGAAILTRIRSCALAGVKAVIFSGGGEPLLNSCALDAISTAWALGLHVGLFTNATHLDCSSARVVVSCCQWVRVHLDAVSLPGYRERHGLGASMLERTCDNLRQLNHLARRTRSALQTGIGSVLNRSNAGEVQGLVSLARQSGCQFFQAKHDFELLPDPAYTAWWTAEMVPTLQRLQEEFETADFRIHFTTVDYTRTSRARRCHVHHLTTAVTAAGTVAYCKRLRDKPDWSPGSLRDLPLETILQGEPNRKLSQTVTPQTCGVHCPYLELNDFLDDFLASAGTAAAEPMPASAHANFF